MLDNKIIEINTATVVLFKKHFYLPEKIRLDNGIILDAGPGEMAELEVRDLTLQLERLQNSEIRKVNMGEAENYYSKPHQVLLETLGVRSWGQLARAATSYTVVWLEDKTLLYFSKLDKFGRWEFDSEKTREFSIYEPMHKVAAAIIEDAKKFRKMKPRFLEILFSRYEQKR